MFHRVQLAQFQLSVITFGVISPPSLLLTSLVKSLLGTSTLSPSLGVTCMGVVIPCSLGDFPAIFEGVVSISVRVRNVGRQFKRELDQRTLPFPTVVGGLVPSSRSILAVASIRASTP